jgi:hypothetical protein
MSPKRNPKFKIALFLLIPSSSDEGRDTCVDLENFYVTPCFSHDYHLMLVVYINTLNHKIPKVRVQRERKRQIGTHFFSKKNFPPKKIKKMPC